MIIAIDGTSASGKGTLAKRLAGHYDYAYLETGLLYRAIGYLMLQKNKGVFTQSAAIAAAHEFHAEELSAIDDHFLRTTDVSNAASQVAAIHDVREALLSFQRNFATNPPQGKSGAVLDGRDIGSVICPDAPVKIFVTATLEERAKRRAAELVKIDEKTTYDDVFQRLKERDERDMNRHDAPLVCLPEALLLDTTDLEIDQTFRKAVEFIDKIKVA